MMIETKLPLQNAASKMERIGSTCWEILTVNTKNWSDAQHVDAPLLERYAVHVWHIPITGDVDFAMQALNVSERQRAARGLDAAFRRRFVLSRSALRCILASYLKTKPGDLVLTANEHGKPELADKKLRFNLSHAGDWLLLAVAREAEVGVDIERISDRHKVETIATRFFSAAEREALMAFSPEERIPAFYRAWSRKEAVIKALGEGLACPLSSFEVSLERERAELLAFRRDDQDLSCWTLHDLVVPQGYTGALAIKSTTQIRVSP